MLFRGELVSEVVWNTSVTTSVLLWLAVWYKDKLWSLFFSACFANQELTSEEPWGLGFSSAYWPCSRLAFKVVGGFCCPFSLIIFFSLIASAWLAVLSSACWRWEWDLLQSHCPEIGAAGGLFCRLCAEMLARSAGIQYRLHGALKLQVALAAHSWVRDW